MYAPRNGFGFEPVSTVITASKVASASGGLLSAIGSIFGYAPRGELQKFQRTHYPYMRTLAANSGYNVYCWWFGELVVVTPDGSYSAIMPKGSAQNYQEAYANIPTFEGSNFYYTTINYSSDPVNTPSQDTFTLMYEGKKVEGEPAQYVTMEPTYPDYPTAPITKPTIPYDLITDTQRPQVSAAGFLPTGTDYMLPLLILGGIAAVVAFSGPNTPKRRQR